MEVRLSRRSRRDFGWAMLFLLPNIVGFAVFVAAPVVFSLVMAFTNWDLAQREPFGFVGFENFERLFGGPEAKDFRKAFGTTLYFMLGMPVSIAGSLLLAVLLSDPIPLGSRRVRALLIGVSLAATCAGVVVCAATGRTATGLALAIIGTSSTVAMVFSRVGLRTLFYLPYFTAGVAQYILWKLMFRPDSGPINASLRALFALFGLDIDPPDWLGSTANLLCLDPQTGLPAAGNFGLGARDAIVIMGIWAAVGGNNMLLYLAGLANVPQDLYEAAMIDGAGRWKTFWHVSWPQLAPTTFFIVVMSIIGGLQGGFEQAKIMTEGNPAETTISLGFYIYLTGFADFRLGLASAVAWTMFVMILAVTLVQWRLGSRQINA
ncbi:MAG: sugar ABC transporter permease [Phycisphaerae bacterium]|nr:sugar ABC transporter permease [Phycisphaerae bacterium]